MLALFTATGSLFGEINPIFYTGTQTFLVTCTSGPASYEILSVNDIQRAVTLTRIGEYSKKILR